MPSVIFEVVAIFLLIILNGIFAMAEIAIVSSRKTRLQQWADEGDARARAALDLANAPNHFLATIHGGIRKAANRGGDHQHHYPRDPRTHTRSFRKGLLIGQFYHAIKAHGCYASGWEGTASTAIFGEKWLDSPPYRLTPASGWHLLRASGQTLINAGSISRNTWEACHALARVLDSVGSGDH